MGPGDALDDGQAEADARVAVADPSRAALERLDERGDQLAGELLAGVLDGEHRRPASHAGGDPHAAALGEVVDDRVVHEVRRQLLQERAGADGGGRVAGGLEVRPRCSARGRSVSVASSATRDRSTYSRVKDPGRRG